MSKRKRIFLSLTVGLLSGLFVIALFWFGGFDFDQRGEVAAWVIFLTTVATLGIGAIVFSANHPYK